MAQMYFMALLLPAALDEKVRLLKQQLFERYRCRTGLKSPAHITIIPPFWMDPAGEVPLMEGMEALGQSTAPFTIAANGFSAFRPRTIFIAVEENAALHQFKAASDAHWQGYAHLGVRADSRPFHPHITIATRDLQRVHFFEAWPQFEGRAWKESWTAASLALLRHNGNCWELAHEAPFGAQA